jgi:hypothetical protein
LTTNTGEFGNLWKMCFDNKGRIYVTDIVNKRISFFDKETGHFQEAIKPGDLTGAIILLPNGTCFASSNTREEKATGMVYTILYGIFDRNFKLIEELRRERLDYSNLPVNSDQARFFAGILSRNAYKPSVVTEVADNERILVGYPERYEIDIYDMAGKPRLQILKDGEPQAVTERNKDYFFKTRVLDFLATSGAATRPKDEDVRKAMVYPRYLPAYSVFIPMDKGFLFVVTESLLDSSAVDLFDSKGVYVGRFTTDVPAATLVFRNGKAYGIAEVGDYQFVKRYAYSIQAY